LRVPPLVSLGRATSTEGVREARAEIIESRSRGWYFGSGTPIHVASLDQSHGTPTYIHIKEDEVELLEEAL
jgi:hypothetical protein